MERNPPFLGDRLEKWDLVCVTRNLDGFVSGRHTWKGGKQIPTWNALVVDEEQGGIPKIIDLGIAKAASWRLPARNGTLFTRSSKALQRFDVPLTTAPQVCSVVNRSGTCGPQFTLLCLVWGSEPLSTRWLLGGLRDAVVGRDGTTSLIYVILIPPAMRGEIRNGRVWQKM